MPDMSHFKEARRCKVRNKYLIESNERHHSSSGVNYQFGMKVAEVYTKRDSLFAAYLQQLREAVRVARAEQLAHGQQDSLLQQCVRLPIQPGHINAQGRKLSRTASSETDVHSGVLPT